MNRVLKLAGCLFGLIAASPALAVDQSANGDFTLTAQVESFCRLSDENTAPVAIANGAAALGQGSQFNAGMVLALGTLFCTVAGYFGVQPFMELARAGQGPLGFGALHAISVGFYLVKIALVAALAWRAAAR